MSGVFRFLGYTRLCWALARHRKEPMKEQHHHYIEGQGWLPCWAHPCTPDAVTADLAPAHGIRRLSAPDALAYLRQYVQGSNDALDLMLDIIEEALEDLHYYTGGLLDNDTGDGWGSSPEVTHPTITD